MRRGGSAAPALANEFTICPSYAAPRGAAAQRKSLNVMIFRDYACLREIVTDSCNDCRLGPRVCLVSERVRRRGFAAQAHTAVGELA